MILRIGACKLRGQVLVQRTAHGGIDQLQPAADAEHRHVQAHGLVEQLLFELVPRRTQLLTCCVLLPVEGRVHILPAGQEQTVHDAKQPFYIRILRTQGQNNGDAARAGNAVHIAGQHPDAALFFIIEWRNADYRFHTFLTYFISLQMP